MVKLDILAVGNLERDDDGNILQAHSTSTLIRSGDRLIVVDTSSRYLRPALKNSFRELGVFMKDVDTVILTHSHSDHTENLDLFPNANVYLHAGGEEVPFKHETVTEDMEIAEGVRLVHTPGHTPDSMSVFVKADRNYAVAGDAVPLEDNIRKKVPPRLNYDPDLAMQSIKSIVRFADVIVPGHGFPFMTTLR
jgi:glyoxylase-like metal-dependent hydrolase (beta-lactamase superfamily II)